MKSKKHKICIHDRNEYYCRICKGAGICQHDRRRNICHECCGKLLCPHKKQRHVCKLCNGASICIHQRIKNRCINCRGSGICKHLRIRSDCKECHGSSFCEHSKKKYVCRLCNGTGVCIHKKERAKCRQCNGNSFCIHNKAKHRCALCGGGSLCVHKRRKDTCRDCGSISICVHKKQKSRCIDCNGSSICKHQKLKYYCKLCNGSQLCEMPLCETIKNKNYKPYCFRCFVFMNPDHELVRNFKTKELHVRDFILQTFPQYTWICDKTIPDGCSLRRPDVSVDLGSHVLFIEIDEEQHTGYTCENKRIMQLSQDIGHRPSIFLRFNPDKYTNGQGVKIPSCWKRTISGLTILKNPMAWAKHLEIIRERILFHIHNIPDKTIHVEHLFFNGFAIG